MSSVYNSIPYIEDAVSLLRALTATILPALEGLLANYQLQNQFGVVLAHRHFELMSEEEQVVDLSGCDIVVTSVFRNGKPDFKLVERYGLEVPDPFAVVPTKFLVGKKLVPYEYRCVPVEDEDLYWTRISGLPSDFLAAWYEILERHDAKDQVGLIDIFAEESVAGIEYTDVEQRVSVVHLSNNPPVQRGYVPTVWRIQDGSGPTRSCCCPAAFPDPDPIPETTLALIL